MHNRAAFCLAVLIGLAANAQTINLGGVVSNTAGQPVADAVVTLALQGMKDTTGTDGRYLFVKSVAVQMPARVPQTEEISINNGVLRFTLNNSSSVKIETFDVKGNLLTKEIVKSAAAGAYRYDIAKNFPATNLIIIKAAIGDHAVSFPCVTLNSGKFAPCASVAHASSIGGGLARMAALPDTIKVTAAGYLPKTVAITSYDNQQQNITLETAGGAVTVQLAQTKQTIAGFGINNNWAPGMTTEVANALFDSINGLGLTILRIGMGSNGEAYNSASWSDIKLAKARGCKYIIGSTWSPPAGWKTNNSENDGGYLKPEYYTQWADRLAAFPGKVKSGSGFDLYAMSLGNEPDFASCGYVEPCNGNYPTTLYNDTQMVKLIKLAGPKLHAAGCKVMAPEASEWLHTWSNQSACCSEPSGKPSSDPLKGKGYDYGHALYKDKEAWAQLDIMGVHQYDDQIATPWPIDVPEKKPVWQTEMSGVKWWPEQGPSTDISNGVAVAGWLHNALTVGEAAAWCWWWWKAMGTTNEGLLLQNGTDTKRRYTFGNFTRFIRPGMIRVDITGSIPANILLTAYKGTNGAIVIVAINNGAASATVPVSIAGGAAPAALTPWVTSASDNLVSKTAVTVSGGTFTAVLAGKTVTTFVGK